jgi:hypothetical protein
VAPDVIKDRENPVGLLVGRPTGVIFIPTVRGSVAPGGYPARMAATGGFVYLTKTVKAGAVANRVTVTVTPSRGAVPVLLLCSDMFPFGVHDVSPPPPLPPPPQDASRDKNAINRKQLSVIFLMDTSNGADFEGLAVRDSGVMR